MTAFLIYLIAVLGFALGLYWSRVAAVAKRVVGHASGGVAALLDSALMEDQKEAVVRKAGIALMIGAWSITWRILICLAAAGAPVYLADALGLAHANTVLAMMLRVDYIIGVSVALIVLVWAMKRRTGQVADAAASISNYSGGDRFLHMLAFSGPNVQRLVNRIEDAFYGWRIKGMPERAPIFVTSLARGGTTAVLNALNDLPETATHTYRDLPFITAPLLWGRLSALTSREVAKQKRAHGDGLTIDLDSPEAFDEVYWRLFWPEKYKGDRISLWTADDRKMIASDFFRKIFCKISILRGKATARYLSKNNANIARLELLPDMFEHCDIVVPLRRPAPHAASLLRQHENFLKRHAEDEFARRYMRDIGHLEFGMLHKPIAFEGQDAKMQDPRSPNYWLSYWISAFTEVRRQATSCYILPQDDLRRAPVHTMRALCSRLNVDTGDLDFATHFRSEPDETDTSVFDPALLEEADRIYAELAGE